MNPQEEARQSQSRLPSAAGADDSVDKSEETWLWEQVKQQTKQDADAEPALASFLFSTVLSHPSLIHCLAFHLGNKLSSSTLLPTLLYNLFFESFIHAEVRRAVVADLKAVRVRDPSCRSYSHCLLYYKGFLALQAHRVTHRLWLQDRPSLALSLQSRISDVFAVDIHPGARIGSGVLLDHATGIVIGETSVIGNNVSLLHNVTLGGTGKLAGDRHPKIGDGALIGAAATLVGNVRVGDGAKIGPGSVVLNDVPAWATVVGNPARLVGGKGNAVAHSDVAGESMDHTSFVVQWLETS